MTFLTLYNLNESEQSDLKKLDWANKTFKVVLYNVQNGSYQLPPSIKNREYDRETADGPVKEIATDFIMPFEGLTIRITNGDYGYNINKNGRISIWIRMFNDESQIRNLKNISKDTIRDIVYKFMVKNKNIILHELVHVYQDDNYKVTPPEKDIPIEKYYNEDPEVDAYIMEFIALLKDKIEMHPEFKDRFKKDISSDIWTYTLTKLIPNSNPRDALREFLKYVNDDNKRKLLKRISTHLQ